MRTILRIATVDIEPCPELSDYNYSVYRFKQSNKYDVTHIVEIHDDVSEYPVYHLGVYEQDKFVHKMSGEGESHFHIIPKNKFTMGGVWFDVELLT